MAPGRNAGWSWRSALRELRLRSKRPATMMAAGLLCRKRAELTCPAPAGPGLGVEADEVVLLVVVPNTAHEDAESLVAALVQQSGRVSGRSSLRSRRRVGSCLSRILTTTPVRPALMGPLMAPTFISKSCGATWPTCAEVGHLSGRRRPGRWFSPLRPLPWRPWPDRSSPSPLLASSCVFGVSRAGSCSSR